MVPPDQAGTRVLGERDFVRAVGEAATAHDDGSVMLFLRYCMQFILPIAV